jgi:hypothetical protein
MSNEPNTHVAAQPATTAALSAMILAYVRLNPDGVNTDALHRFEQVDRSFNQISLHASLVQLLHTPRFKKSAAKPTVVDDVRRLLETQSLPSDALPSWDRPTHTLSFGRHPFLFKSNAVIVVAILEAFQANNWMPIEEIPRWMPMKEQLSRTSGTMPESRGYTLEDYEVRDGLTILKRRTKGIIGWHRKGCGASWERLV